METLKYLAILDAEMGTIIVTNAPDVTDDDLSDYVAEKYGGHVDWMVGRCLDISLEN